jgi:hypothetical protein
VVGSMGLAETLAFFSEMPGGTCRSIAFDLGREL